MHSKKKKCNTNLNTLICASIPSKCTSHPGSRLKNETNKKHIHKSSTAKFQQSMSSPLIRILAASAHHV